ncbi:MAG: hypothetical protein K2N63_16245 [Lachnospiraceae bacterium]|nr:hypothetical protein [Lachnospiraceae bacterium]
MKGIEETFTQKGGVLIPWGDSISVDLDGDGKKETVSMRLSIDSVRSNQNWHDALPVLIVEEAVFGEEDFWRVFYSEDKGGDFYGLGWCVLDIDVSDSYVEIAVEYYEGRDFKTCFLRYGQGEFAYLGSIETNICAIDADRPIREESEWEKPWEPDWEATRTIILNSDHCLRMDGILGDGVIKLSAYHDILEQWEVGQMTWCLDNPDNLHAELILAPEYLDYGEPVKNTIPAEKLLEQDTIFYKVKGEGNGETVALPAGTKIWFRRYYPKDRWMEITYDEGGGYKEGKQSAWFQVVEEMGEKVENLRGTILLPEGEMSPEDCFRGLVWGG